MTDTEFMEKSDGVLFLPGDHGATELQFVKFHEPLGEKIVDSKSGDTYHVCFLKFDPETENLTYDESFEAIFADPIQYIKGLMGTNVYGAMFKKREKSSPWFEDYLKELKKHANMTLVEIKG